MPKRKQTNTTPVDSSEELPPKQRRWAPRGKCPKECEGAHHQLHQRTSSEDPAVVGDETTKNVLKPATRLAATPKQQVKKIVDASGKHQAAFKAPTSSGSLSTQLGLHDNAKGNYQQLPDTSRTLQTQQLLPAGSSSVKNYDIEYAPRFYNFGISTLTFPVSLSFFMKYTFYEKLTDEILKKRAKRHKENFEQLSKNAALRQDTVTWYYERFYLYPEKRSKHVIKLKPCPKRIQEKILSVPVLNDNLTASKPSIGAMNSKADTNEGCLEQKGQSATPAIEKSNVPNLVRLARCFRKDIEESDARRLLKIAFVTPNLNSGHHKFPISLDSFKKCTFYDDVVNRYIRRAAKISNVKYESLHQIAFLRHFFLTWYYWEFYVHPEKRLTNGIRLKPCPKIERERILSVATKVDQVAANIGGSSMNTDAISPALVSNVLNAKAKRRAKREMTLAETTDDEARLQVSVNEIGHHVEGTSDSAEKTGDDDARLEASVHKLTHHVGISSDSAEETVDIDAQPEVSADELRNLVAVTQVPSNETRDDDARLQVCVAEAGNKAIQSVCSMTSSNQQVSMKKNAESPINVSDQDTSKNPSFPVTLELFKQCTYYDKLIDEGLKVACKRSGQSFEKLCRNEKEREKYIRWYYQRFYAEPEKRAKHMIKLRACPRHLRDKILSVPGRNAELGEGLKSSQQCEELLINPISAQDSVNSSRAVNTGAIEPDLVSNAQAKAKRSGIRNLESVGGNWVPSEPYFLVPTETSSDEDERSHISIEKAENPVALLHVPTEATEAVDALSHASIEKAGDIETDDRGKRAAASPVFVEQKGNHVVVSQTGAEDVRSQVCVDKTGDIQTVDRRNLSVLSSLASALETANLLVISQTEDDDARLQVSINATGDDDVLLQGRACDDGVQSVGCQPMDVEATRTTHLNNQVPVEHNAESLINGAAKDASEHPSFPVTLELFKQCTYYDKLIDEGLKVACKRSGQSFEKLCRNEKEREKYIRWYYQRFYAEPEKRAKHMIKLRPCPKQLRDKILSVPERNDERAVVTEAEVNNVVASNQQPKLQHSDKIKSIYYMIPNMEAPPFKIAKVIVMDQEHFTNSAAMEDLPVQADPKLNQLLADYEEYLLKTAKPSSATRNDMRVFEMPLSTDDWKIPTQNEAVVLGADVATQLAVDPKPHNKSAEITNSTESNELDEVESSQTKASIRQLSANHESRIGHTSSEPAVDAHNTEALPAPAECTKNHKVIQAPNIAGLTTTTAASEPGPIICDGLSESELSDEAPKIRSKRTTRKTRKQKSRFPPLPTKLASPTKDHLQKPFSTSQALAEDCSLFNSTQILQAIANSEKNEARTVTPVAPATSKDSAACDLPVRTLEQLNQAPALRETLLYFNINTFYYFAQLSEAHIKDYTLNSIAVGQPFMCSRLGNGRSVTVDGDFLNVVFKRHIAADLSSVLKRLDEYVFVRYKAPADHDDLCSQVLDLFFRQLFVCSNCLIVFDSAIKAFGRCLPNDRFLKERRPSIALRDAIKPSILEEMSKLKAQLRNAP